MYYIVNGKKLDPNGRPVGKNPPPNNPEHPFLAHAADLPPAPEDPAEDDPADDETTGGTVADVSTPLADEDEDEVATKTTGVTL